MNVVGYFYIREHESYTKYDACKIGITKNIPERDMQYATGEIKRGQFTHVYKIWSGMSDRILEFIENIIHNEYNQHKVYIDGGTEFFKKEVIHYIEPLLNKLNITYIKLSKEDIQKLTRINRIRNSVKKLFSNVKKENSQYYPYPYQNEIIETSYKHYQIKDKGILVLPCGVGKTFISIWIAQRLTCQKIVIGVPNRVLLEQWNEIVRKILPDYNCLRIDSSMEMRKITNFLENNAAKSIILTTYASSFKLNEIARKTKTTFDMKINDEVHHLTKKNIYINPSEKEYIKMLYIPSKKELSLTATIKTIEGENIENTISNDNTNIFGDIILHKSLLWAIQEKIVCDYCIQTISIDEEDMESIEGWELRNDTEKRLFIATYIALKSINEGYSHHLLIYCNNQPNTEKINKYIDFFIRNKYFHIENLYYSNYHSNMSINNRKKILNCFRDEKYGILSSVYCLGEGIDIPYLDGVVFSENMISNIRIIQSALRACRKNKKEPNKIAKIILPILNKDDWFENNTNQDLKKVTEVISQLGINEDEMIIEKIKTYRVNWNRDPKKRNTQNTIEYDLQFTKKIRLKTKHRLNLKISYEKAKQILVENRIQSKSEYANYARNHLYLPSNPKVYFGREFKGWIDYLSIQSSYYTLKECIEKTKQYIEKYCLQNTFDVDFIVTKLCKIDDKFPPKDLWKDYYMIENLTDIVPITYKKRYINI